jgi:CheY-like chemotaxis protein
VLTAPDGKAALDLIRVQSIDLLLTDIQMPVMDGPTLVRRLREIGESLPSVIFIGGVGDVNHREMYALGVEAFISKPLDRSELLVVLKNAVAERSTLWHTQMAKAPRQSLLIEANRIDKTASVNTIGLGRGGFSICSSIPISPGKVAFRLLLVDSAIEIVGQGFVRWRSRTDCKVGIEIAYLDPGCMNWLTEAIDSGSTRSFIPGS